MRREIHTTGAGAGRAQASARARDRFATLRGTRRTGFLGVPEIAALGVACALLALALAAYFLLLVPARSNVSNLERERGQLQRQILSARESKSHSLTTGEAVEQIRQSIYRFESDALETREASVRELIAELNDKTKRSGLARAQFSFIYQDDTAAGASQVSQQRAAGNLTGAARRRQTVFPATDISLSIEGNYANVRRFIRDIEQGGRFVVINGVQLESVNETGAGRGALVSLRLDMSAYFRRTGAAAAAANGTAVSGVSGTTAAQPNTSQ